MFEIIPSFDLHFCLFLGHICCLESHSTTWSSGFSSDFEAVLPIKHKFHTCQNSESIAHLHFSSDVHSAKWQILIKRCTGTTASPHPQKVWKKQIIIIIWMEKVCCLSLNAISNSQLDPKVNKKWKSYKINYLRYWNKNLFKLDLLPVCRLLKSLQK